MVDEPLMLISRRPRSTVALTLLIVALGLLWFARAPLLRTIAALWVVPGYYTRADAVVVLGGGLKYRPRAAADLYKRGFARWILVPNSVRGEGKETVDTRQAQTSNREVLLRFGVPPEAIVGYGYRVSSTYEEACAVVDWAQGSGIKAVIVPTELFSSRRIRWIFERKLSAIGVAVGIEVLVPDEYNIDNWWRTRDGMAAFRREFVKYTYYRVRY